MSQVDLWPRRVSAGEVVYPPGGRLGPRRQDDVQLVLVHAGHVRIAVDGVERPVQRAGTVGLLLPGHREHFAFADGEPTHHSWVQAELGDPPAALLERLAALPAAMPASSALTELVREAVAVARTPLSTAAPLLGALAAAAVWRYAGEAEAGGAAGDGSGDAVDRARRYLHEHLGDPSVDLARVAAAAYVTPAHLVRRFRAELGVTPMAYLWRRRVATGIDLLTHTGLPVGEVAARCGFKSVYHFSRRVRAQAGLPPTRLREARWRGLR